jgi:MFS family permease
MKTFILFIKENRPLLFFGLLFTFFSAFGQTYFISLFVPSIISEFALSNSSFGSMYAIATMASAAVLPVVGKWIDHASLQKYSAGVVIFLALSLLLTATALHPAMLILGLWGQRLGGQGLMSHTSISSMARFFDHARGKAISIASLGYPIGEALFPLIIITSIGLLGWRQSLLTCAALLLLCLLPLVWRLGAYDTQHTIAATAKGNNKISQWQILKSKTFFLIAPSIFILGFLNTALLFYQIQLATFKGWTPGWMALCFSGFAIASFTCMILSGLLVDRFSAKIMFPFYLLPYLVGLLIMIFFDQPWIGMVYMTLLGISNGFGSTIKSALQAEMFDVTYIGAVKSLFSTMIVLSTAIGPALFGFLLDAGLDFSEIIALIALVLLLIIIQSFRVISRYTFKRLYLLWFVKEG